MDYDTMDRIEVFTDAKPVNATARHSNDSYKSVTPLTWDDEYNSICKPYQLPSPNGSAMFLLSRREVYGMVSAAIATIVIGLNCAQASDSTGKDSVKVEVEGQLGLIVRQENSDFVTATIRAGGGEFVVDGSKSDAAKKVLLRLADSVTELGLPAAR